MKNPKGEAKQIIDDLSMIESCLNLIIGKMNNVIKCDESFNMDLIQLNTLKYKCQTLKEKAKSESR